jgi:hypothetical protein
MDKCETSEVVSSVLDRVESAVVAVTEVISAKAPEAFNLAIWRVQAGAISNILSWFMVAAAAVFLVTVMNRGIKNAREGSDDETAYYVFRGIFIVCVIICSAIAINNVDYLIAPELPAVKLLLTSGK